MTPKRALALLPIIIAFAGGKRVQYRDNTGVWYDCHNLNFEASPKNYRLKPERKLVPFTIDDASSFRDRWITNKQDDYYQITSYDKHGILTDLAFINYKQLMEDYQFDDGLPCGKYVE